MEKPLRYVLTLFACLLTAANAMSVPAADDDSSSPNNWNSTFLSMDEGLPHNYIDDILIDSSGFVWLASQGGGLARYDGYAFLTFNPASDRHNIRSSFISSLAEDRFRRLWVGSDLGLDIIDLNTLAAIPYRSKISAGLDKALSRAVRAIQTDTDGNIWVQTDQNLVCLSVNSSTGTPNGYAMMDLPPCKVNNLLIRSKGDNPRLYMSISEKLCEISLTPGNEIKRVPMPDILELEPGTLVSDILERANDLWIATDRGLYRYNEGADDVKHYIHDSSDEHSLSQNCLTALSVTPDRRLAIGSLRGVNIYNPIRDNFDRITDNGRSPQERIINNNFINCMIDGNNSLWIGTEGGGANILSTKTINSRLVTHNENDASSLSAYPVNVVYYDKDKTQLIGTVEGGLNRRTAEKSGFEHFTMENSRLSHNSVSAIAEDRDDRLWIGTWGGGVNIVGRRNPADWHMMLQETSDGQDMSYIGVIIPDSINNGMWIGSNRELLFCDYDFHTTHPFNDNEGAFEGCIGAVVDRNGHLWVGGSTGLLDIDLNARKADGTFPRRYLKYRLDDPASMIPERVSYVYEDAQGTLWIGSNGNGLYERTTDAQGNETFRNYSSACGLVNDMVRTILDDTAGNIWVATYHGISCISANGEILNFEASDGIGSGQFYWNAACKSPDGKLLFGAVDGLVVIEGGLLAKATDSIPVRFTKLFVNNAEIHGGSSYTARDISVTPGITIHERDRSFAVEFSAMDYGHTGSMRYYYRLYPFEEEWIELPGNRRYVSYTNLSSGDYRLEVRYAASRHEIADAPGANLEVTVKPFFYKTFVFYMFVAILAGAVIWLWLKRKMRKLSAQNRRLEQTVDQRVRELKESHAEQQKAAEQIDMQQTQIADMTRKVNELTMDRIAFFTNITHEFRTPITLIIGPIQRALKLSYNPQVIEQLHYVERNSKYLLSLVNQLMDFRKLESGKFEIVKSRGDFLRYTDEILNPFDILAGERGITIRRIYHMDTPVISFDDDALRKVLTNLLGNAVKFTPDGGTVTVYVALLPTRPDYTLYISVADTGSGIPAAEIENVFDRFFQGKSQMKYPTSGSSGSGIGLYLCKNIIEMYGGSIGVRNNRNGHGCTFRISLPVPPENGAEPAVSDLAEQNGQGNAIAVPAPDNSPRLVVLVVEDVADMRSFIASILRDHYTVVEAANGEEAMKILLDRQVDFIVSDLMMPVMDGLELSRKVKENFAISHIPFLMLTAKNSPEARLEGYRVGVDEYLLKPFDEQLLLTRIRNILENKRRYQSKFNIGMDVDALNIQEESRDKKFIDSTMQVIRDNYRNSYFEVGDFAEALGISRSLLNKKLQNLVGQSAGHLIRTFRMNMARELILKNRVTKQMNISEIAYEVGFNDSKYFTRCFTKHFGITPSAMLNGTE